MTRLVPILSGWHGNTVINKIATAGISAAGATQGSATGLTTSYNEVTIVAPSEGVRLPPPTTGGLRTVIVNQGANPLLVYPDTGHTIDNNAVNAPITVGVGETMTLQASSTTQWYSLVGNGSTARSVGLALPVSV